MAALRCPECGCDRPPEGRVEFDHHGRVHQAVLRCPRCKRQASGPDRGEALKAWRRHAKRLW